MSYIDKNLRRGERIIASASVSWAALVPILLKAILILAVGTTLLTKLSALFTLPEGGKVITLLGHAFTIPATGKFWDFLDKVLNLGMTAVIVYGIWSAVVPTLRLFCTELAVTDRKLIGKTGILNVTTLDVYLEKIDNVSIDETIFGRLLRYSTVSVGTTSAVMAFRGISNAAAFKRIVLDCIDAREEERMRAQAEHLDALQRSRAVTSEAAPAPASAPEPSAPKAGPVAAKTAAASKTASASKTSSSSRKAASASEDLGQTRRIPRTGANSR